MSVRNEIRVENETKRTLSFSGNFFFFYTVSVWPPRPRTRNGARWQRETSEEEGHGVWVNRRRHNNIIIIIIIEIGSWRIKTPARYGARLIGEKRLSACARPSGRSAFDNRENDGPRAGRTSRRSSPTDFRLTRLVNSGEKTGRLKIKTKNRSHRIPRNRGHGAAGTRFGGTAEKRTRAARVVGTRSSVRFTAKTIVRFLSLFFHYHYSV